MTGWWVICTALSVVYVQKCGTRFPFGAIM